MIARHESPELEGGEDVKDEDQRDKGEGKTQQQRPDNANIQQQGEAGNRESPPQTNFLTGSRADGSIIRRPPTEAPLKGLLLQCQQQQSERQRQHRRGPRPNVRRHRAGARRVITAQGNHVIEKQDDQRDYDAEPAPSPAQAKTQS